MKRAGGLNSPDNSNIEATAARDVAGAIGKQCSRATKSGFRCAAQEFQNLMVGLPKMSLW